DALLLSDRVQLEGVAGFDVRFAKKIEPALLLVGQPIPATLSYVTAAAACVVVRRGDIVDVVSALYAAKLLHTATKSPLLLRSVHCVTGIKFTFSPQAAFIFASVLPLPLALNSTPTPPCAIEPEVMFGSAICASSSSSNTYGVLAKSIVAPVLL